MKKLNALLCLSVFLFPFSAFAISVSAPIQTSCAQALLGIHGLDEASLRKANETYSLTERILQNFLEISRIFRASNHEAEVREFLVRDAQRLGLSYEVDTAGNLLVRVPARNSTQTDVIALQGHLDMVPNVKGATSKTDAEDFLRRNSGVLPFEFVDGHIQSVGHRNTIGADNGSAIAIMMEYMRNDTLTHPPLELIFTVQEEVGLLGSEKLAFKLKARKTISMDSGRGNDALIGALGATRWGFSQKEIQGKSSVNPRHSVFLFDVSGFLGGHSGLDIHLGGANGVREMALLLSTLKDTFPEMEVLSLNSGINEIYNAIPTSFKFEISLEASRAEELSGLMREFRDHIRDQYQGIENAQNLKIDFQQRSVDPADESFSWKYISRVLSFVRELPNGKWNSKWPTLITDNQFSSNFAFLSLDSSGFVAGVMPRFYAVESLQVFQRLVGEGFGNLFPEGQFTPFAMAYPWVPSDQSHLKNIVLTHAGKLGLTINPIIAMGSVEASSLARLYPGMEIVVIGVEIKGEHNPDERMELQSLADISRLVDESLKQLAKSQ